MLVILSEYTYISIGNGTCEYQLRIYNVLLKILMRTCMNRFWIEKKNAGVFLYGMFDDIRWPFRLYSTHPPSLILLLFYLNK